MTTEQSTKLSELLDAYTKARNSYEQEKLDNYNFQQGWISTSNGIPHESGNDRFWFKRMYDASTASLAAKKANMESALGAYNLLFDNLAAIDKAAFQAANPTIALEIEKETIKGKNELEATKLKLANEATENFADRNSTALIVVAIVIVVIVITTYFIIKSKNKKTATAAA